MGWSPYLRRYVVMSDEQADALTLWTAHTHAFEAAEATPYLHVTSAEKESGKTRLLEALELVAARVVKTGGTTAAALARAVAQDPPPTMLLDESDNTFKRDREYVAALMGVLNDGYRRGGRDALVPSAEVGAKLPPGLRTEGTGRPGALPDTVASRSIRMSSSGERLESTSSAFGVVRLRRTRNHCGTRSPRTANSPSRISREGRAGSP